MANPNTKLAQLMGKYVDARVALRTGQHTDVERARVRELEAEFDRLLRAAIEEQVLAMVGEGAVLGRYRQQSGGN